MKKIFKLVLFFTFFSELFLIASEQDQNPAIFLNIQDTPIFSNNNPIKGLTAFTVIPPILINHSIIEKKLEKAIVNLLQTIGDVIFLNETDMRGFGAGNILSIQIKEVVALDGKTLPISRCSLQIQTPIIVQKTNMETFPVVWTINNFIQNEITESSLDQLLQSTIKITTEFVDSYKYINRNQDKKPIFYIYE